MKLYFSPLACSLASHIVAAEIDLRVERVEVDPVSKTTSSGDDYLAVHPLGLVPALRLDGGELLTENAAVLSYLADLRPSAALAPREPFERAELQKWLSFVGTELHKAVFSALLDVNAPDASREQSLERARPRLAFVAEHLSRCDHLLDRFGVADAYLFAVLNWSQVTPIDLKSYPPLMTYMARILARPAVAQAVREEMELYRREQERRARAARPRSTRELMARFNEVFLRRDPAELDSLVGEGCVLDNTDGSRHVGKEACVALWRSIATDPKLVFEHEETRVDLDRAIITWKLRSGDTMLSGVNLMRVRDGKIVEARGYLRG